MIKRSNQGGQKGKRQGAPSGKGRKSSSPRTSDAKRHSAPRGSDGGRDSAPRKNGFGKTSDKAYSKPFGKSGDKPFSKGGDRPFQKSGDRDFSKTDRKPFGQSEDRPHRGGSERPFRKSGERDFSKSDRKPFERETGRPERRNEGRDFDKQGRKPFDRSGERPARSEDDRPNRKSGDRNSDRTDRKPYGKSAERPARRDEGRDFDKTSRKPFDRGGERPARSEDDRPNRKSGDRNSDRTDRKPYGKSDERPARRDDDRSSKKSEKYDFGKTERKSFAGNEDRPVRKAPVDDLDGGDFESSDDYKLPTEAKSLAWDYEEDGKAIPYVDYTKDDGVNWDDDDDSEYEGRAIIVADDKKEKAVNKYDAKPFTKATSRPYKPAELKIKDTADKPKKKGASRKSSNDGTTRLNKLIAQAGVCSRREADTLIAAGVIEVNGSIISELGYRVGPTDKVSMSGQSLVSQNKVYILLNKPKDYITTSNDPQNRRTVFELIKDATRERVFSVGRLDRSTTGVLLFTNDGEVAERLTHPSFNKKKIYQVELHKSLTGNDFHKILEGLTLEDGFIAPDALSYVDHADKSQIGVEIHSGRNRIVRRIFEHLGYTVVRLDRVYYAGLTKKNLPRGKWRFLNEKEIAVLKQGAFE